MADEQPLKKVNYFDGQLLTAQDFQAEQDYFTAKHRRHNRFLHGSGVVWGLEVKIESGLGETGQQVFISPGFAIDPGGDEILVPETQQAQLSYDDSVTTLWVVVCYAETPADQVPLPVSLSEEGAQVTSRVREGFKIFLNPSPNPGSDCPASIRLARLVKNASGWALDITYRPPQLGRFDQKTIWTASILSAACGLLVGLLVSKRGR